MRFQLTLVCLAWALRCSASEPVADVLACRAIADSADRLSCFDRATAALAGAAARPTAAAGAPPRPQTRPERTAPVLDAQQSFGLNGSAVAATEEAAGARPPKVSKIEAHVSALALAGNGDTVFTLDNSQVWRQTESSGELLATLGVGVTISRGLLGSYWLQLKSGRGCKVTRLR
ncbi:MAG: hypothetical protein M3O26_15325 [Pseudomonadota bacterium]|nr:hypothetical protein [Pseudomonadota bacterium]